MVKKNLHFLIGLRHEIEHQMTTRIDDQVSAKFQAAALNFNTAIKKHFGTQFSLDTEQAFSIQFSGISETLAKGLMMESDLPLHIKSFVVDFENGLSQQEFDDPRFSYRVAFIQKTSNSKTVADKVVTFVAANSEVANAVNRVFLKETEKTKYRPSTIVKQMKAEGFTQFNISEHTYLWQSKDAKNPKYQYGTLVEGSWFWYESWMNEVRKYCGERYKPD